MGDDLVGVELWAERLLCIVGTVPADGKCIIMCNPSSLFCTPCWNLPLFAAVGVDLLFGLVAVVVVATVEELRCRCNVELATVEELGEERSVVGRSGCCCDCCVVCVNSLSSVLKMMMWKMPSRINNLIFALRKLSPNCAVFCWGGCGVSSSCG